MKVRSLLASEPLNVLGSRSLAGWAVRAALALGAAKVLASSAMTAARSPPVSPGSSPGSGNAADGVWIEGLLEGFSGGTGALPSACAWVSGMFEGKSVSLVILLCTEPGTDRVGSGLDQDLARGQTWLQQGSPLRRLGLHVLYFDNPRTGQMLVDVGTIQWVKQVTGQEYGSAVSTL